MSVVRLTCHEVLAVCMEVKLARHCRHLLHLVATGKADAAGQGLAICSNVQGT